MTRSELKNKMREKGASDAQTLRIQAAAGELTDTEIIDMEIAVPEFDGEKDYTACPVGTPVQYGEQVYGLLQPYNAANYTGAPDTLPALWGVKHTKNPRKAKPFVAPFGTSGLYQKDECCLHNGSVYVCLVANNPYSPSEHAGNWTRYSK